jgi:hypothetical protein
MQGRHGRLSVEQKQLAFCRFSAPIGQPEADFASTYRPVDFQHL